MPQSMDIKRLVKEGGYTILAWALRTLVEHGQYQLSAMIIVSLCSAPRETELENNGVLSVLRNHKLRQLGMIDGEFKTAVRWMASTAGVRFDKIAATLVGSGWWEHHNFHPQGNTDPAVFKDDEIIYYVPKGMRDQRDLHQLAFCDLAGSQSDRHFPHFRFMRINEWTVRVISKQMDRHYHTSRVAKPLANEYAYVEIPVSTVICTGREHSGKTLGDVMKIGEWCNYHFELDTPLDIGDPDIAH